MWSKKKFFKRFIALFLAALLTLPFATALAAIGYGTGEINVVEFSHHDLGWHIGTYIGESGFTDGEINDALAKMNNPSMDFKWTHEYNTYVYSYLQKYPEKYDELYQRVLSGEFDIGAGYSQPYSSFVSAEILARQFYLGKRWVEQTFPGFTSKVYYNTDIPGLGTQMPQILSKAGVPYLYASRSWNWDWPTYSHEFKLWKAPDGSTVNTYFMNHYGNLSLISGTNITTYLTNILNRFNADLETKDLGTMMPATLSMDCRMPADYLANTSQITSWNSTAQANNRPRITGYSTMASALDRVFANANLGAADTLEGEWPNKWFYEVAGSDYEAFNNQRQAERFLRAAETLGVFRAITEGTFENYPVAKLDEAWRGADFSCHGYAPAANIEEFRANYQNAYNIGKELFEEGLAWLTARIASNASGVPFTVYNTLSWNRDDIVVMDIPDGVSSPFIITDSDGAEVVYQNTYDGKVAFIATGVPSFGYKTYYFVSGTPAFSTSGFGTAGENWTAAYENSFYRITPYNYAIDSIVDLTNGNKSLFNNAKFRIGEWVDFTYSGMGAGEQRYIWQPTNPVRLTNSSVLNAWKCVEAGPVRTVFELRVKTERSPVTERVVIYNSLKKIDFNVVAEAYDSVTNRQARLMFPINAASIFSGNYVDFNNATGSKVTYEVPFGAVDVGSEVLRDFSRWNPNTSASSLTNVGGSGAGSGDSNNFGTRPREVQNWISAGDNNFSVTFSNNISGWDYQDAAGGTIATYPVLQPMMLASPTSCNGSLDNWRQPGRHEFTYMMTSSDAKGDIAGQRMAYGTNNPLIATVQTVKAAGAALPQSKAGLTVDKDNVVVTALKKAEDNNKDVVVRFFESAGKGATSVNLTFPETVSGAGEVTLIEYPTGKNLAFTGNTVTVETTSWSIETAKASVGNVADTPMAPYNLSATAGNGGINVRWFCKTVADKYVLEMKIGANGVWTHVADTTEPEHFVPLAYAGNYYFRVKSVANGIDSQYAESRVLKLTSIIKVKGASASGSYSGSSAMNTVNGSGISDPDSLAAVHDNHQNAQTMWQSNDNPTGAYVWIEWDLGAVYSLDKMYIWNYNQYNPSYATLHQAAIKYTKLMYTEDGVEWKQYVNNQTENIATYGDVFKLAPGTGQAALPASNLADGNAPIEFNGLKACKIRFEIPNVRDIGNYGWYVATSRNAYGLSEVMFTQQVSYSPGSSNLAKLSVDEAAIVPVFNCDVYNYNVTLPYAYEGIIVRTAPENPEALVRVNGSVTRDGISRFKAGIDKVEIVVESPDKTTTTKYTLDVTETAPEPIIKPASAYSPNQDSSYCVASMAVNDQGMSGAGLAATQAGHNNGWYMWNTIANCALSDAWIRIDLGAKYALDQMWIWNYNQTYFTNGNCLNRGLNQVYISYSDNINGPYTRLANPEQSDENERYHFLRADGSANMPATNLADGKGPVEFGKIEARYIRLEAAGGVGIGNFGGWTGNEMSFGIGALKFTGSLVKTSPPDNVNPIAEGVGIKAGLNASGFYDLTASYTYNPVYKYNAEGESLYQWYEKVNGSYVSLTGENSLKLNVSASRLLKSEGFKFEVTPVNADGLTGSTALAEYVSSLLPISVKNSVSSLAAAAGNTLTSTVTMINANSDPLDVVVFSALYRDGKLIAVTSKDATVSVGPEISISISIDVPSNTAGMNHKLFVWDADMVPLFTVTNLD